MRRMSLLTRLVAPLPGEVKLPVHQFMAAIVEFKRNAPGVSLASISAGFQLSIAEQNQLQTWYTTQVGNGNVPRELVHDVLMLGEIGLYSLAQVQNRLGL